MTKRITPETVILMREWIGECQWNDIDERDIDRLSTDEVIEGVRRWYAGGVRQFLEDAA